MRVELRGGNWAELRDPDTITNRDRQPYTDAVAKAAEIDQKGNATIKGEALEAVSRGLMAVYVEAWSFPFPVPSQDAESYWQLPSKASDQIMLEIQKLEQDTPETQHAPGDPTSPSSTA